LPILQIHRNFRKTYSCFENVSGSETVSECQKICPLYSTWIGRKWKTSARVDSSTQDLRLSL